jgi:hypothetical protein
MVVDYYHEEMQREIEQEEILHEACSKNDTGKGKEFSSLGFQVIEAIGRCLI